MNSKRENKPPASKAVRRNPRGLLPDRVADCRAVAGRLRGFTGVPFLRAPRLGTAAHRHAHDGRQGARTIRVSARVVGPARRTAARPGNEKTRPEGDRAQRARHR